MIIPTFKRKSVVIIPLLVVLGGLAVLYALCDPAQHFFPRCPIFSLTGLQCPGCGSQRAIHALIHGDLSSAWRYNALLVCSLPFILISISVVCLRSSHPRVYNFINSSYLGWSAVIIILLWGIIRNIF